MEFGNCQLPTIGVRTTVDRHSIARNLHHDTQSWNLHHTLTIPTVEFTPNDFFTFYDQWDFLQVSFSPRPWKLIRRLLLRPWNLHNLGLVNHIARTLQRWNYYQVHKSFTNFRPADHVAHVNSGGITDKPASPQSWCPHSRHLQNLHITTLDNLHIRLHLRSSNLSNPLHLGSFSVFHFVLNPSNLHSKFA